MTITDLVAYLNVQIDNGIALLAERGVTEDEIRADIRALEEHTKLDLNDCTACVLAAVYGSYAEGLARLGISEADARLFGFDMGRGNCDAYIELTRQWRIRLGLEEAA